MSTFKVVTSPFWLPFWLVWTVIAFIGRMLWGVVTFTLKVAIVVFAIFGLIVWLWW